MNKDNVTAVRLGLLFVATVLVLSSCNTPANVTTADEPAAALTKSQPTICPSIEDVCDAIVDELNQNCPINYHYRNWGDENSCEKSTIGKALDDYDGCYTKEELKDIRECIAAKRALPTFDKPNDDGNKPHEM